MKNFFQIFSMLFDYMAEPVLLLDEKRKPVTANTPFLKMMGDLLNKEVKLSEIAGLLVDLKDIQAKEPITIDLAVKDQKEKLKVKVCPLPEGYFLLKNLSHLATQDIKRNLHSQRIETLGMLAGGVAHDFNNILTGLLGHVTYLKNVLPQSGSHLISIKAIEEGTKRASSLTKEILNFSRLEPSEKPRKIDLSDLLEKTYNLLKGAIPPQFELSYEVPKEPVIILADEAKIAQIIVNLAVNARDALSTGGYIKIQLSIVTDKKELKKVLAEKDLSIPKYACLKVIDNGTGMSKEVLSHVFEPYFSTKNEKGNGLGLSIVSEVVNMYSGAIHILTKESTEKQGGGTTISVYFPIFEDQNREIEEVDSNKSSELSKGSGNILVVDDEQPVRNVLSLSLEHLGYTVTCAASGEEAIEIYKNSINSYDLIILDMLMPHMTGDQTFFHLKEIDPNVKVLLISGYSSQEAVSSVLENGGLGIIQKPFTISDLATRVRQCI